MRVIHAVFKGTKAFLARNLETGDEAVVLTEPIPPAFRDGGPHTVIDLRGRNKRDHR